MSGPGRRRLAREALPRQPEDDFQAAVLDLAEACGWTLRYHTRISDQSPAGYPDLTLCRPRDGRLLIAELKTDVGPVSPAQKAWLAGLDTVRHFDVRLWRPRDLDEIAKLLR